MSPLIVSALRKSYDGREVVAGLDFELQRGECYGLLRPSRRGRGAQPASFASRLSPNVVRPRASVEPVP